ncbi:copper homeostasis periplasmic binding protein CopC [Mesorhizobium sp. STM 4661]|uniref:copper homeostasis periplasmic binding protein CopC n=1 Tax=Mesorhizobium sp. STM 4661 TaxID=1297570 RepID=UPI0002BE739A|nr:copper homeostasis periplasmic binding protein CopC [Mesorhizobium sp. STM 4661]CCV15089.1 conserved exported hypothetical protein [Mesorhizobium sp. STM 4661]
MLALWAALGLAFGSAPTFAHANLTSSVPAADSTVPAPAQLELSFTEEVNLRFSAVKLSGPDGSLPATGAANLAEGNMGLIVPVTGPLTPGSYSVDWNVLSVDGHKLQGTFSFNVAP